MPKNILMVLLGFLGAWGQGLAIAAYRNARMSVVIPTQHTMLLWAALFAVIMGYCAYFAFVVRWMLDYCGKFSNSSQTA